MQQLVLIIHVLAAIGIVALVLLQHGKGSDVGASFGAGSANTMMGSAGALPVLLKITAFLGAVFFSTSLILANMAAAEKKAQDVITMPASPTSTKPIIPIAEPKTSQPFVPTTAAPKKTQPSAVKNSGNAKNKTMPKLKSSSSNAAVKSTKKK